MKSKQTIEQEIARKENQAESYVSGSPEWSRVRGYISALKWVLRD